MKLAVPHDGGEGLLLNGGGAQLNALQHARIQDIHTGVDAVTDELDGLLDEPVNARGVLIHFCDDDGPFIAVALVKLGQLLERIVTDDI